MPEILGVKEPRGYDSLNISQYASSPPPLSFCGGANGGGRVDIYSQHLVAHIKAQVGRYIKI